MQKFRGIKIRRSKTVIDPKSGEEKKVFVEYTCKINAAVPMSHHMITCETYGA